MNEAKEKIGAEAGIMRNNVNAGSGTLNHPVYDSKGINVKRFLVGLPIFLLGCAAIINLPLIMTGSWIEASGIFALILLIVLLFASAVLTYGYLKFARARGFLASGVIFLLMALPLFNIAGIIATSPLSCREFGGVGLIIAETILFYTLWFIASLGIWMRKNFFYCQNCKTWSDETYSSASLEGIDDVEMLKKQLADNDIGILCELKGSSPNAKSGSRFTIRRCSKCGDAYIFVTAAAKRPFRGPFKDFKYILKNPSLGGAVAGTVVDIEDVVIKGQLLSKENFDTLRKRCRSTAGRDANN